MTARRPSATLPSRGVAAHARDVVVDDHRIGAVQQTITPALRAAPEVMNLILLAGPLDRSTGSDALSIPDVDDATEIGVLLERSFRNGSSLRSVPVGSLEEFKRIAADSIRLAREKDTGTIRYDIFSMTKRPKQSCTKSS